MMYQVDGLEIEAIANDHCSKPLKDGRWYEQRLLQYVAGLNLDGTYLDIGAFVGNHSTFFRRRTKASRVVAVEPNPLVCDILARNAERHDFEILTGSVLGRSGQRYRAVPGPNGNAGMTRYEECDDGDLPGYSLADLFALIGPTNLVKIDIEGALPRLLADSPALQYLDKHRPHLIIEAATPEEQDTLDDLLGLVGYRRRLTNLAATPTWHWQP